MGRHRGHALRGREHAPDALRRRVIAGVRREQTPVAELSHRAERRLRPLRALLLAVLLIGCAVAIVAALDTSPRPHSEGAVISTIPGARASLRRAGGNTELKLSGMSEPGPGRTYEAWLLRSRGPVRAVEDMFTVTHSGHAVVVLPGYLSGVREVMLTEEPIGGSKSPQGPVVLRLVHPSALAHG
jgi:hypothetical protein